MTTKPSIAETVEASQQSVRITEPQQRGEPFRLTSHQWLPRTVDEIFPFFADINNLDRLTPDDFRFRIVSPEPPIQMRQGLVVDMRVTVKGIPMLWRARISDWDPPHGFTDEQLKGPYHLWSHRHRFQPKDGGVLVSDEVDYKPMGGWLAHKMFVRSDLKRVFGFRRRKLAELFDYSAPSPGEARA
jgi:ligand-binding SRPBCC domain-containing protein